MLFLLSGPLWASRLDGLPWLACPSKQLTGWPCPLCGSTRALLDLARWDFAHALATFPLPAALGLLVLGLGLIVGTLALLRSSWQLTMPSRRGRRYLLWLLLASMLGNWAYSLANGV